MPQQYDMAQMLGLMPAPAPFSPNYTPTPQEIAAASGNVPPLLPVPETPEEAKALQMTPQQMGAPIVQMFQPKAPISERLFEQLSKRQTQGLSEQRRGIDELEKQIKSMQKDKGAMDLMPLMVAADYFGGTNLAGKYQALRPQSKEQKQQQILALENLLQKHKSALTGSEIDLLKAQYQHALGMEKAQAPKEIGESLTPGQKKADQEFAKEYADFYASGGYADVEKSIDQLEGALKTLKSGENVTGPVLGALPNFVKTRTNPKAAETQQAVEEVVQRNLRLILGAQFTEKEGQRLIERAYDPSLSEAENAKRVERLLGQIKEAAKAKQDAGQYFEQYGTLKGFKGTEGKSNKAMPSFEEWKKKKGF